MPQRRTLIAQTLPVAGLTLGSNAWPQAMQMRISHAAAEADWLHKSMVMFKENVEAALTAQAAWTALRRGLLPWRRSTR